MSNISEIPEALKKYQPRRRMEFGADVSVHGMESTWDINYDEMKGTIEIAETKFHMRRVVFFFFLLFAPIIAAFVYVQTQMSISSKEAMAIAVVGWIIAPLAFISCMIIFPLIVFHFHYRDGKYWGKVRFVFDVNLKELTFPHDNKTYQVRECRKFVLCCVRGYDMIDAKRAMIGFVHKGGGKHDALIRAVQYFMLVLDSEGNWQRHDFSCDQNVRWKKEIGTKRFCRCFEILKPFLPCESYVADFSAAQCFAEQQSEEDKSKKKVLWQ